MHKYKLRASANYKKLRSEGLIFWNGHSPQKL